MQEPSIGDGWNSVEIGMRMCSCHCSPSCSYILEIHTSLVSNEQVSSSTLLLHYAGISCYSEV